MSSQSFLVLVTGNPTTSQAHLSAIRFIKAAIVAGHKISSIFFYQDAVNVANRFVLKPSDEAQLSQEWQTLSSQHNIELQVCVAAANRRGVVDQAEAEQNAIDSHSIVDTFKVLGLGQLAAAFSDPTQKLVQFK